MTFEGETSCSLMSGVEWRRFQQNSIKWKKVTADFPEGDIFHCNFNLLNGF